MPVHRRVVVLAPAVTPGAVLQVAGGSVGEAELGTVVDRAGSRSAGVVGRDDGGCGIFAGGLDCGSWLGREFTLGGKTLIPVSLRGWRL